MAAHSFRDRFFSPPVARALTSPSGILSLGAGAAVGIVATAPVSVPLALVGAVVGGAVGLGARLAVALPRKTSGPRIDPFAVNEPWRHAILDAIRAQGRFTQAIKTFKDGPLKDTVAAVADRLDEAVDECWRVAQQGQLMTEARSAINDREVAWELQQAQGAVGAGASPNDTQARRIQSLESQLETASRMDRLIESTKDQLDLLNARLDESVTRAIELSVSNQRGGVGALGNDVGSIVDELASLRLAMEDVDEPDIGTTGSSTTGRGTASTSSTSAAPPPPPPPAPRVEPGAPGTGRTARGS